MKHNTNLTLILTSILFSCSSIHRSIKPTGSDTDKYRRDYSVEVLDSFEKDGMIKVYSHSTKKMYLIEVERFYEVIDFENL